MNLRLSIVAALCAAALGVQAGSTASFANGSTTAAPPNDNFADAVVLSGDDVSRLGDTNVGATLEAGEPTMIGGAPAGASVWYRWTASVGSASTRGARSAV